MLINIKWLTLHFIPLHHLESLVTMKDLNEGLSPGIRIVLEILVVYTMTPQHSNPFTTIFYRGSLCMAT